MIDVPCPPIKARIALSILFVPGEIVARVRGRKGLAAGRFDTATAAIVPAYAIGGIACYWVIARVAAFWG